MKNADVMITVAKTANDYFYVMIVDKQDGVPGVDYSSGELKTTNVYSENSDYCYEATHRILRVVSSATQANRIANTFAEQHGLTHVILWTEAAV